VLNSFGDRETARAWEYRQRRHAHGVWYRLRRVLTSARATHVISDADARTLIADGCRPETVGGELDPPKVIIFAPEGRIARLASARPVAVRLSAHVLAARCLALTPFEAPRD